MTVAANQLRSLAGVLLDAAWPAVPSASQSREQRGWRARLHVRRRRGPAVQQLERLSAILDAVFDGAPIGLALLDQCLRFVRVNRSLSGMSGVGVEDHYLRRPEDVMPGWGVDLVEGCVRPALERGAPIVNVRLEPRGHGELASSRSWQASAYPVRDSEERPVGVGVVLVEIGRVAAERREEAATHALSAGRGSEPATAPLLGGEEPTHERIDHARRLVGEGRHAEAARLVSRLRQDVRGANPIGSEALAALEELCVSCGLYHAEVENLRKAARRAALVEQQLHARVQAILDEPAPVPKLHSGEERALSDSRDHPSGDHRAASAETHAGDSLHAGASRAAAAPLRGGRSSDRSSPRAEPNLIPGLTVYGLGPLRVYERERAIERWSSRRGKSVFKYLVLNRERPVPKEVLMELLWPGASPDSARNNLNVAIYGLRRALRAGEEGSISHVVFRDDAYLLNPDVTIWIDVEEFERLAEKGRRLIGSGEVAEGVRAYEAAEALYQGDLFEDDPYEEWVMEKRAAFREVYLDLLAALSSHRLACGDYSSCADGNRKILAIERYREEAHRDLMRCYSRQGQPYLALRQYFRCRDALREDLDVNPDPETTGLYEAIRRHARV